MRCRSACGSFLPCGVLVSAHFCTFVGSPLRHLSGPFEFSWLGAGRVYIGALCDRHCCTVFTLESSRVACASFKFSSHFSSHTFIESICKFGFEPIGVARKGPCTLFPRGHGARAKRQFGNTITALSTHAVGVLV